MSWTEERIDTLTRMWESGMTASQIAEELGGISRNAVIGKAHRLGLKPRPSPVKANADAEKPAPAPAVEAAKPAAPAPKPQAPAAPPPIAAEADDDGDDVFDDGPSIPTAMPTAPAPRQPELRSVGPGGFVRQNPGEQAPPSTPAPPRRLVPARPSEAIAGKTSLLDLNDRVCKWPIGHPGEPDFHFCGDKVNPGFPYCVEHCGHAYQAQLPRRDRRPPPPLPYGGPRVR
ncbi:GcrA cell cycle regulator [Sphingomonas spermidinifaciens]|uniref:GcrA cell cycle regulator n=1 Tax=Sphingomonas spermidinifaciens TaxID=1141889 RepID=A0A2A4B373_9SPHN|nr:GcrA family cell cycle regulator [Sphingomonas spermidinifaciens]PCD02881.1 GcrA cell cycle regulator [Sphingomonas spermidinifaciens]